MQGTFSVCLGLPIGYMKFLLSKKFITVFGFTFTPHKSNFFLLNLIGPSKKKLKLWSFTKIEDSMDRWSASSFGPLIYVRRGGLWAKHMGLKQGAIGNTHEEHIGNLLEQRKNEKNLPFLGPFPQNLKENPWGTHWEPIGTNGKWKKSSFPRPSPKLKRKKQKTLSVG